MRELLHEDYINDVMADAPYVCKMCGNYVGDANDDGYCEVCAKYQELEEENIVSMVDVCIETIDEMINYEYDVKLASKVILFNAEKVKKLKEINEKLRKIKKELKEAL